MEVQTVSRQFGSCLVCGDIAVGINFSVPTCAPCKAFFRRNAVKLGKIDFICQEDGDCPVTWESRRVCNCCRLAKCFRVGMKMALIRSDAEREARKDLVQRNRQKRKHLLMLHNLGLIQLPKRIRLTNAEPKHLRSCDVTLLSNIIGAYERACTDGEGKNLYYPTVEHSCPHTFFNDYRNREVTLIDYFKLIPEFNKLSVDDKIRLIRNHFGAMYYINEPILIQYESDNLVTSIKKSFSSELAYNMLHAIDLMTTYASDPIFLKLILIVRSLSSGINRYRNDVDLDRIYDDTRAILAGQNVYVELLWRYLLSRLPSERDTIRFFDKFIRDIMVVQRTYLMADCYLYSLGDEIDQLEPLMQSMWPKPNRLALNCSQKYEPDILLFK